MKGLEGSCTPLLQADLLYMGISPELAAFGKGAWAAELHTFSLLSRAISKGSCRVQRETIVCKNFGTGQLLGMIEVEFLGMVEVLDEAEGDCPAHSVRLSVLPGGN